MVFAPVGPMAQAAAHAGGIFVALYSREGEFMARVRWHGALPQPHLPRLYQRATAVVMPSLAEGLGLVAVEAQLCEAPVVGKAGRMAALARFAPESAARRYAELYRSIVGESTA